jgi:hypothetical protein
MTAPDECKSDRLFASGDISSNPNNDTVVLLLIIEIVMLKGADHRFIRFFIYVSASQGKKVITHLNDSTPIRFYAL